MGRTHTAALLLAALVQGSAGLCTYQANLTVCEQAATATFAAGIPTKDRKQLCAAPAYLEGCIVQYVTPDCDTTTVSAMKALIQGWRNTLTATYGIECAHGAGGGEIPLDLSSGDSGSNSGSGVHASSGSPSGSLTWQWVFWGVIFAALIIGACVGACMFMQSKKKSRGKGKGGRYDPAPEEGDEQMMQAAPMEEGGADAGYPDNEGIPDAYQAQEQAQIVEEVAPLQTANFERAEAEPLLFGPVSNLLPGPTSSTIVAAPQYTYSPQQYSYPAAAPQTTSNYMTYPGYQAGQPTMAAQPQYATTAYAPQVAGTIV